MWRLNSCWTTNPRPCGLYAGGKDQNMSKKIIWFIFAVLAVILLPVTCLWAFFAYLAGDTEPLFTLRGKNVEDPIDNP